MSSMPLLKFICKDPMCKTLIPVVRTEPTVQCHNCGIKYDSSAFEGSEPFAGYEDLKKEIIRRIVVADRLPKRGAESVKVNGLSNLYCKLLSPLLTHYGMDPATGQARLLSEMNKGDIFDCSLLKDRAFLINPDQLSIVGFGKDMSGSTSYLSNTLKIIMEANDGEERLVPIYTDGDGHCLVHAISRALVGRELFWHPLRCCLKRHVEQNLKKYQELFQDFTPPEDWKAIIEEIDPDFKPPEGELHGLRNVHIFGLANILKRPIILLDSLGCMKMCGDYSALFLPGFIPPEECRGKDNTLNKPICIAWSSFSHNHYIPLVGVQKKPLPVLPKQLIPKVWGMPQSQFDNYVDLDSNGNCVIGGSRTLTESYIQRLVKSMEALFLEKKGVHPMLVADAKLYLYSEPAYLSPKMETLIENTRAAAEKGCLYRCLYCTAICSYLQPCLFSPGGVIYNLLAEKYRNFNSYTSYKVDNSGLSCKYDPAKNEFFTDVINTVLPNCTACDSSDVCLIKPDGTTEKAAGNDSSSSIVSGISSQENGSLVNRMVGSKAASSQENQSIISKALEPKAVSDQGSTLPVNQTQKSESSSNHQNQPMDVSEKDPPASKENDGLLHINFKWKNTVVGYFIPTAEFRELGSSPQDCVSTLAFNIAAKYFPNDYQDVHLHVMVSDEIWNQISKTSFHKSPMTLKEDKQEKENKGGESQNVNAATSEPQCIKLVTSSGQEGNLTLRKEGMSYSQLQQWIAAEFKIPHKNQKIKVGFPPKEIEVPMDVHARNLPLKHGDRILVEVCNLSTAQQKNYQNTTPQSSLPYIEDSSDIPKITSEALWTVTKCETNLFQKGGSFYKMAVEKLIVFDKGHVTLPCFPTKRFCFNASTNTLELCVKSLGHFQISTDVDERVERARRGLNVPGFKKCPLTSGPSRETISARPYRKPLNPAPEEARLTRRGPGYSVLTKPSDNMDFL